MNGVRRTTWIHGTFVSVCIALAPLSPLTETALAGLNGGGNTWTYETPDGQYVLVMIAHGTVEEEIAGLHKMQSADARRRADEVQAIRDRYAATGLYRKDDSIEPLWTIRYWSRDYEPQITSDGRHLVLTSSDWGKTDGAVLFFHEDGKAIAQWWIEDLMEAMPALRWRVLVRGWRSPDSTAQLSPQTRVFTLRTEAGEVFEFDATTGTLLRQSSPWPFYFVLAVATPVMLGTLGLLGFVLWRGRRSRRRMGRA